MSDEISFGHWLQRRRKVLDLTQVALAQRVGCAAETLRKIEADARRPSRQVAERLAEALDLPVAERAAFIRVARAELAIDHLAPSTRRVPQIVFVPPDALPSGTVTFLFTDIEGSTQLWEQHPEAMQAALARHDTILRDAVEAHGGVVVKTTGDGLCAAFTRAPDCLAAGLAAQRALRLEVWGITGPLRVRMALHTGAAEIRAGDYYGTPLNRVARLMAAGHGGQILITRATQELVRDDLPSDAQLRDLGQHRLKDLIRPEHVFQVVAPDLFAEFPPLNTLDARRHNLPVQPNPLIGRETEVAQVCALLRRSDARLVTLTGPGGVGKTRLAFQVAAELLDAYPSGVYFVPLAPISDPAFVATAITQTLGITEVGGRLLMDTLRAYLRDKQLLLLLDNFEQVVAAAPLVGDLLSAALQLNVLVTSREMLHIRGEKQFPVLPLALPQLKSVPSLETFSQYAAVALFIQQALDVKPDFAVTNENAPAVAEICIRLDGLPLAIELAAAWVKLFAPQALLARLEKRLALLTGGARDLPRRQQTLRNTIAWSYNLLDAGEQKLFRRLAIFVGGCTVEAAEAVCNANGDLPVDALDGLVSLVVKSLLRQTEGPDGDPRFVMLETIREYAREQMEEHEEAETLQQDHAAYYLALAERAERGGPQLVGWLDRLEIEYDNLRAALTWYQILDSAEAGLRLAEALWGFWVKRGDRTEGRVWMERALASSRGAATPVRARALFGAGLLAYLQAEFGQAALLWEESLATFRKLGDKSDMGQPLLFLGSIADIQGDREHAHALYEESLVIFREQGDKYGIASASGALGDTAGSLAIAQETGDKSGIAYALCDLGYTTFAQGNIEQAVELFEESLALGREVGDRSHIARVLNGLGRVSCAQGAYDRAKLLLHESLALSRELSDPRSGVETHVHLGHVALRQGEHTLSGSLFRQSLKIFQEQSDTRWIDECMLGLAEVARSQGQVSRAARVLGSAEILREATHLEVPDLSRADYERTVEAFGAQLDETTFAAAWAEGRAMTLEQAIAYALHDGT